MSLADLIADFVQRQYVAEIGDVRDNVESLFAEDLVYHSGRETLGREDLVDMGVWVRAIPGRTFSLTDLLASCFHDGGWTVVAWDGESAPGLG